MKKVKLPPFLRPKKINSLIRIGKKNDGGYLIDERNIQSSNYLISLGLGNDWSFEKHFCSYKPLPIYVFDGSVNFFQFLIKCINPLQIKRNFKRLFSYMLFFSGNKSHILKYVGFDFPPNYISFDSMLAHCSLDSRKGFFSIDIEGWEYRLLSGLIQHADIIEGLVIEFHDIDIHLDKIEDFVQKFPLTLVHVHCNNYGMVTEKKLPLVIECTFTSKPIKKDFFNHLPHMLDQPCNKKAEDFVVSF